MTERIFSFGFEALGPNLVPAWRGLRKVNSLCGRCEVIPRLLFQFEEHDDPAWSYSTSGSSHDTGRRNGSFDGDIVALNDFYATHRLEKRRITLMADIGRATSKRIRILGAISLPHLDGCSPRGVPHYQQDWTLSDDVKAPKQIPSSQSIVRRLLLGEFRRDKPNTTVLFYSMAVQQVP
jgi:hypothetical protein